MLTSLSTTRTSAQIKTPTDLHQAPTSKATITDARNIGEHPTSPSKLVHSTPAMQDVVAVLTSPASQVGSQPLVPPQPASTKANKTTESSQKTPIDASAWVKYGERAGSNPGGFYLDANGVQWYVKLPKSEHHVRNEVLAAKLYNLFGIATPEICVATVNGHFAVASKIVELQKIVDFDAAVKSLVDNGAYLGFATDVLLANWDTTGLCYDNMGVDMDGKIYRIDVGGSLEFRAQGGPKGTSFGNEAGEFLTMRDPAFASCPAAVFGSMTNEQLIESIQNVLSVSDEAITATILEHGHGDSDDKLKLAATVIARKNDLAERCKALAGN